MFTFGLLGVVLREVRSYGSPLRAAKAQSIVDLHFWGGGLNFWYLMGQESESATSHKHDKNWQLRPLALVPYLL